MLLGVALGHSGCAQQSAQAPARAEVAPLKHRALSSYVPAAGLQFLFHLRPKLLLENSAFSADWQPVLSSGRLRAFAAHSGLLPSEMEEMWVAVYPLGTLYLFDAKTTGSSAESAFLERSLSVKNVATSHPDLVHLTSVINQTPSALVHQRGHMLALVEGDITLAHMVQAYAEGKLKKSPPALAGKFLKVHSDFHASAPLRAFTVGPFEMAGDPVVQDFVSGVVAGRLVSTTQNSPVDLQLFFQADGLWSQESASENVQRYVDRTLTSPVLRALGWAFPKTPPRVTCTGGEEINEETNPLANLTRCTSEAVYRNSSLALATYRVTKADMSDLLPQDNPEGWTPEVGQEEPQATPPSPIDAPPP